MAKEPKYKIINRKDAIIKSGCSHDEARAYVDRHGAYYVKMVPEGVRVPTAKEKAEAEKELMERDMKHTEALVRKLGIPF